MTAETARDDAGRELRLDLTGLGIIMYSPSMAAHIRPGEDYLESHYADGSMVQPHLQAGTIVGFGTGSPGTYILRLRTGYPSAEVLAGSEFKLRLGLHVVDGSVCFRDLYDLLEWDAQCPVEQTAELANGRYHVTLCSGRPPSEVLGGDQIILVYLQPVAEIPPLSRTGIPSLV